MHEGQTHAGFLLCGKNERGDWIFSNGGPNLWDNRVHGMVIKLPGEAPRSILRELLERIVYAGDVGYMSAIRGSSSTAEVRKRHKLMCQSERPWGTKLDEKP